jgi:hypothetical protein
VTGARRGWKFFLEREIERERGEREIEREDGQGKF